MLLRAAMCGGGSALGVAECALITGRPRSSETGGRLLRAAV